MHSRLVLSAVVVVALTSQFSKAERVYREAESADVMDPPMEIYIQHTASGGSFVTVAGGKNSKTKPPDDGSTQYHVELEGGVYKVFGRVSVAGGGDDSFWIRVPGAQTNTPTRPGGWIQWNRISIGDAWHWDVVHNTDNENREVEFTLPAGKHTVEIRYLEDSTLLDALVLTDDLSVQATDLPGDLTGKAYNPIPPNDAVDVESKRIEWTAGIGAVASRLYVGSDANLDKTDLVSNGAQTSHTIATEPGTDYFWRVDTVRTDSSIVRGHTWMFTALGKRPPTQPHSLGSRLEVLVDDHLIQELKGGARHELHHPTPRDVVLVFDSPWEGNGCSYNSVVRDGDLFRMYYRGWQHTWREDGTMFRPHLGQLCYAESRDGLRWKKPELGLVEFDGSKKNNIVMSPGMGGTTADVGHVSVFLDSNPDCPPEARYKAITRALAPRGLLVFSSPDGLQWSPIRREPVIGEPGTFDSQNLAFWDPERKEYRVYFRYYRNGIRDVRTCTSLDFIHWSDPRPLKYPGAPNEHLYTNQIQPYYRAPHIFLGFPARYVERDWSESMASLPNPEHRWMRLQHKKRYGAALSDTLLMTSRDGRVFHRWDKAFLRPGPQRKHSWAYSDHYVAWPLVETHSTLEGAANELSMYVIEGYWTGASTQLRRYAMRIDGFASVSAPLSGGEFITWPLKFDGNRLTINFSSSAAGDVRVEVQDDRGNPLDGYSLADCPPIFGDELERTVRWRSGTDVRAIAGQTVRIQFVIRDADLFAFQFQ